MNKNILTLNFQILEWCNTNFINTRSIKTVIMWFYVTTTNA